MLGINLLRYVIIPSSLCSSVLFVLVAFIASTLSRSASNPLLETMCRRNFILLASKMHLFLLSLKPAFFSTSITWPTVSRNSSLLFVWIKISSMDTLTFWNLLSKFVSISWNISDPDDTLNGSNLKEYIPHGVANVRIFCVLWDRLICQNPFGAV